MIDFLEYVSLYRVVWIRGRLGFGKTALACLVADALLRDGMADGVITNFPSVFPAHINKDDGTLTNRVIIYDEAWADLDARTSMTNDRSYSAYARKMNAFWLFPSVHPVDRRLRAIQVEPVRRGIMPGIIVWKFIINDSDKNPTEGKFSVDIRKAYGKYATAYIPINDCGIKERFQATFAQETGTEYEERVSTARAAAELASISDKEAVMDE